MGRYGKNMRDCCDSVAERNTPHIKGCPMTTTERTPALGGACRDEHQPSCDCVFPEQKDAQHPSFLTRMAFHPETGFGLVVERKADSGELMGPLGAQHVGYVNPDHAPKLLEGEAVAWVSEWQGIGGPSRVFHYSEQDAIDSAAWMEGRCYPLYAHPAPEPVDLLVDQDWLRRRIESDADGDCEAGAAPIEAGLREALEDYDAAIAVCPIRKNDRRAIAADRCPVCFAMSSQGCGRDASASYKLIKAVRSALQSEGGK